MSKTYFKTQNVSTNVRLARLRQKTIHSVLSLARYWAPDLTQRLVLRLFSAPAPYKTSASESACLAQAELFQILVNGKQIKAWRWGAGPAVLMMHGWNGRGIQFQSFVSPLTAAGYTAIAVDGPAHGESEGRITSYFEFTDTARSFLEARQGLDIKGVIGHSFGAGALINALAKDQLNIAAVCIAPVLRLRELFLNTVRHFGVPSAISDQLIADFEKEYGYSLTDDNPYRLLDQVRGPILIVHDSGDRTVPLRDSEEQSGIYSHIDLYTTQGLGHRRILSDPKVINASINHIGSSKPGMNLSRTA
jgi:pimeloyl-ACP methyl ester carboxylesterase